MTSHISRMLTNQTTPQEVLETIFGKMDVIEKALLSEKYLSKGAALLLDENKHHEYKRVWGFHRGEIKSMDVGVHPVTGENGITVQFNWDDYCRGCHVGSYQETSFIPDHIVELYENTNEAQEAVYDACNEQEREEKEAALSTAWTAFNDALRAYVEKQADLLNARHAELNEKEALERQKREEHRIHQEKAMLAALQQKYPEGK